MKTKNFEKINLLSLDVNKRAVYFREYRYQFGDFMREQIKEWFNNHPDYLKKYLKKWRKDNPTYWNQWKERNLVHRRNYERLYYLNHKIKKVIL